MTRTSREYIFALLAKLDEGYDVVNTSRFQPGGGQVGVNTYRGDNQPGGEHVHAHRVFAFVVCTITPVDTAPNRARIIQHAVRILRQWFYPNCAD